MQRSFGFDVLACPRCGNRLELIALIEDPKVIRRILSHLGMPAEVPATRSARPPPLHPTSRGDAGASPAPQSGVGSVVRPGRVGALTATPYSDERQRARQRDQERYVRGMSSQMVVGQACSSGA